MIPTPERQLEIALAAYDRQSSTMQWRWAYGSRRPSTDPVPPPVTIVSSGNSRTRVQCARGTGERIDDAIRDRLWELVKIPNLSPMQIALELGVSSRTVNRYRAKWRKEHAA